MRLLLTSGEIFCYTFGGGEPTGRYAWLGAFTDPGTFNIIEDVAQTPFVLSP